MNRSPPALVCTALNWWSSLKKWRPQKTLLLLPVGVTFNWQELWEPSPYPCGSSMKICVHRDRNFCGTRKKTPSVFRVPKGSGSRLLPQKIRPVSSKHKPSPSSVQSQKSLLPMKHAHASISPVILANMENSLINRCHGHSMQKPSRPTSISRVIRFF